MSEQQDLDSELDSLLADLGASDAEFRSEHADAVVASASGASLEEFPVECDPSGRHEDAVAAVESTPHGDGVVPTAHVLTAIEPVVEVELEASLAEAIATMELSAADVSESSESPGVPIGGESLLLCTLGSTRYGVPSSCIAEVTRVPHATRVPHTPAWVRGVTNLRGDVLSVVDLRVLTHLKVDAEGRMMVARLPDGFSVALIVDEVSRIVSVPRDAIAAPTAILQGRLAPFVRGVCELDGHSVAVLDLEGLLESPEIRLFDGVVDARLTA